jgi:hypothetical protein
MRKRLRDNSLSRVIFSLFGLGLLGHSLAGYAAYGNDQQAHQQPSIRYMAGPAQGTQDTCGKKFPPISYDLTGLVPHA